MAAVVASMAAAVACMAVAAACMAAVMASKAAVDSTTAFPSPAGTWAKVGTAATTLVGGFITISGRRGADVRPCFDQNRPVNRYPNQEVRR